MPTPTSTRTTLIASAKRFAISLVIAMIVLAIGGFGLFLAANKAEFSSSWLLGFGGAIGLALVVTAAYWAAHPATGRLWGTVIALVVIAMAIVGWNMITPVGQFDGGDFALGLLDVGLVLASAGAINAYKNTR